MQEQVDETTTEAEVSTDVEQAEVDQSDPPDAAESPSDETDSTPEDLYPRRIVEELRQENGKYRQRASGYAQRLHTELVRSTGRLADPTDLPFDANHLDDSDALSAAIEELLESRPHLASRRPVGDIGQGVKGQQSQPFSLMDRLKGLG